MANLLALGISAIPAVAGYLESRRLDSQADAIGNTEIPEYIIPETEFQSQAILNRRARRGFGDRVYRQYTDFLASEAQANRNATLRLGGGVNDIAASGLATNRNFQSFALQDARQQLRNELDQVEGLRRLSRFQDRAFELNELNPAIINQQRQTFLRNRADETRVQAFNNLASGVLSAIAADALRPKMPKDPTEETETASSAETASEISPNPLDGVDETEAEGLTSTQTTRGILESIGLFNVFGAGPVDSLIDDSINILNV